MSTSLNALAEEGTREMGPTTALPPPSPGSDAAIARGCICAVLDNSHGAGYLGQKGLYVITCGCPLHCPAEHETAAPPTSKQED